MAEQRGGEVRDDKTLKDCGSGAKIDAKGEDDMLMKEKRIREVRDEKEIRFGGGGETVDADEHVGKLDSKRVNNFNKNITGQNEDGDNKAISFIPDELSGPRDDGNEYVAVDSFYTSGTNENVEDREFGRDTNRLDYFRVTSFDVHGDQSLPGIASYGGGGGGGTRRVPRAIAGKDEGEGVRSLRWWEKCWLKLTCRDSSM
ncbi:hypothetical protein L2E82_18346 [Cichorium intybus]|uniref:Uncharacterized protein n=1 Tax=Cichorium intybus TaxID=13427 RepID=A0ACB9FA45_CICIN|nr:hypothetical protein L2E82_18346 [Cichorium intybus]